MSTDRTAQQWLALDDDELIRELSKMQPGPWKHDVEEIRRGSMPTPLKKCRKCGAFYPIRHSSCPVPDPITIDWNTAMEWQRKYRPDYAIFRDIYMAMHKSAEPWHIYLHTVWKWIANMCEVKEGRIRLIAAAMAAGRKEE